MRRAMAFVFALLVLAACSAACADDVTTVRLYGLGLTIDLPDNLLVLTPGLAAGDPVYEALDMTPVEAHEKLGKGCNLFYATSADNAVTCDLSLIEGYRFQESLESMGEWALRDVLKQLYDIMAEAAHAGSAKEIETIESFIPAHDFLRICAAAACGYDGDDFWMAAIYVFERGDYTLMLTCGEETPRESVSAETFSDFRARSDAIALSVARDDDLTDADAHRFTDPFTGMSFAVPDNLMQWLGLKTDTGEHIFFVEFVKNDEEGRRMAGFAFHTEDFAENYNASNLNGAISRETAAAWLAIPKNARRLFIEDYISEFEAFAVNGHVCYRFLLYDMDYDEKHTYVLYPQDGYICHLHLGGDEAYPLYPVFESVVNSMEFAK